MSPEERKKTLEKLKTPAYEVFEEAPFWFNGAGFTAGKRSRIYLYNRSNGALEAITGPWFECMGYVLHGTKLLYKGVEWHNVRNQKDYPGIWLYDIESGETRCVLKPGMIRTGAMDFLSDDVAIVAASDDAKYGAGQYMDFYTLDLNSGEMKLLAAYEASIGSGSVGSDARLGGGCGAKAVGEKYYFVTTVGDNSYLRCVDRSGAVSEESLRNAVRGGIYPKSTFSHTADISIG
jgi:dipeptidyl aminopeptidase/acylaminoacyl peptidase